MPLEIGAGVPYLKTAPRSEYQLHSHLPYTAQWPQAKHAP